MKLINAFHSIFYFNFFFIVVFIIMTLNLTATKNLSITSIYSPYIESHFNIINDLETRLFAEISNLNIFNTSFDAQFLSLSEVASIKHNINIEKNSKKIIDFFKNTETDYQIIFYIDYIETGTTTNFYDSNIEENFVKLNTFISIIDTKSGHIIENITFTDSIQNRNLIKDQIENIISIQIRKIISLIKRNSLLQKEFKTTKKNYFIVQFTEDMKFEKSDFYISDKSMIRMINKDKGQAIIYYYNENDNNFTYVSKIPIKFNINAGIFLYNLESGISPAPAFDLNVQIPSGVPFFSPLINASFFFIFGDGELSIPFSINTGILGEFYINRLTISTGLTIGAFFTQKNTEYQIDSFKLRPFITADIIVNQWLSVNTKLSYQYLVESVILKEDKIDLSGVNITLGLTLLF